MSRPNVRALLLAGLLLSIACPVLAAPIQYLAPDNINQVPVSAANPLPTTAGGLTGFGQSATVIRPANTTAYASGQAVCASTSVNCTPLQVTVAGATGATGTIGRVWLLKSGSATTNASFNVSLFSSAPIVTSVHDASSYVGPFAADVGNWVGDCSCTTPTPTSDGTAQQKYECIPTSPTSLNQYQALGGQTYVDAMIWTAGAYTPASGETFTVYANSYRDK